jgi:hypothetical protein
MKITLTILAFFGLFICMVSCENENEEKNDFYETDYRTGIWINPDRNDTLDFVDDTHLIRKGDQIGYEEYLYRIESEILLIKSPNSSIETQHPILSVRDDMVILGNIYASIGFIDDSGTFQKE